MRIPTVLGAFAGVVAVVAITASASADMFGGSSGGPGFTTLADVAAICDGSDPTTPGIVEVPVELRDSNTNVELGNCIIRLVDGADVTLNNVTITGGIVNLHDRDTPTSSNRIKLQRTTFDVEALLIELNDADDEFSTERLDATVVRGFSTAVAETQAGANDGGSVRMVNSSVLALDEDAPVTVRASEHSGTVDLVNTSLDTRGLLTVIAGQCSGRVGGEVLDCSTDALADALEAP